MLGSLAVCLRFCRPFLASPQKQQGALQVRRRCSQPVLWLLPATAVVLTSSASIAVLPACSLASLSLPPFADDPMHP
jgi:hypothetical protein